MDALLHAEPARSAATDLPIPRLAELAVAGGWPARRGVSVQDAAGYVREYVALTCDVDVPRVGGPRRDPARVRRLMMSLARNLATEATLTVLAADTAGAESAIDRGTVADYLEALDALMVVEDQPPWAPHIRSASVLRKSPKRHFTDPSLALAAMGAGPERLLDDLNYFGFVFESMVVRDLRILSGPLQGSVLHYRDNSGLEVDAIVVLPDGTWGAFEVKLGAGQIDQAATSLLKFADTVDQTRSGAPATLAVITPSGYGYRRPDGVDVVPLAALSP
jgi:predicted AAA+ superfamily ATPase